MMKIDIYFDREIASDFLAFLLTSSLRYGFREDSPTAELVHEIMSQVEEQIED